MANIATLRRSSVWNSPARAKGDSAPAEHQLAGAPCVLTPGSYSPYFSSRILMSNRPSESAAARNMPGLV